MEQFGLVFLHINGMINIVGLLVFFGIIISS